MRINKFKLLFLLILSLIAIPNLILAQSPATVNLTIFYSDTCPHCHKELAFLDKLEQELPNLKVRRLEVVSSPQNIALMSQVASRLGLNITNVPFTVIGDETLTGYLNDETTGNQIRQIVLQHSQVGCSDIVGEILSQTVKPDSTNTNCAPDGSLKTISLPFFGNVDIKSWSLPILTIILGLLDGFNPCALWVLLFLISLLTGENNRKKMWLLGSAFLVASALTYFLFLIAWLNLLLFLGFITIIRAIIGVAAIAGGIYHIWDWYRHRAGGCHVSNDNQREKIMNKLKKIVSQRRFVLALIGIITLAFAVNLVELVCSAGLPAIFTQILALAKLSTIQYYAYLLLYIVCYMLLAVVVFIAAMTTLQLFGISTKFTRWATLISGILILILGILLIFKPGWVMLAG